MVRLARAPPIVGLALALGCGATLFHMGVSSFWTLLPLSILLLPIKTFRRPGKPMVPVLLAFVAGSVVSHAWSVGQARDCRLQLREGQVLSLSGRMLGPTLDGAGEFRSSHRTSPGCAQDFRVVLRRVVLRGRGPGDPPRTDPGEALTLYGTWRRSSRAGPAAPLWSGYLLVDSLDSGGFAGNHGSILPELPFVILGGWVQARLKILFPTTAGLASALVWARKEGLDPEVRDAFARAGTAHLLAISGFHVGVVAGLLLLLWGHLGFSHNLRYCLSTAGVWLYVAAIGAPDAALRASLLFSILAGGRFMNRSVSPLGALSSAFAVFLLLDPGALVRPGFQLSFSGALGLVLGYRALSSWLSVWSRGHVPAVLSKAVAAGVSATLATLPLVAWHFGRVSLVGIPMTLVAGPMVALAIPGIFATLVFSLAHPALGAFLARGVDLILRLILELVQGSAGLPFSSAWVSRPTVIAGVLSLILAILFLQAHRVPRGVRRPLFVTWSVALGVLVGPLATHLATRGVLELVVLDVGQGDALLLRSPENRWILIDAGPRTDRFDAGSRTILPYLRRRGIRALDLLVLTHADMDHVGGAPAILRGLPVKGIGDPGRAVGKGVFLEVLHAAQEQEVPWWAFEAGDSLNVDGVALRIVSPEPDGGDLEDRREDDANAASIVLEVRFGGFSALLTGDAPASSEVRFLPRLLSEEVQVLKVGHHGSSTSTTREFLDRIEPEVALISVGRRNRYGHPHQVVLDRLHAGGTRVLRTDLQGTLVVEARRDGNLRSIRLGRILTSCANLVALLPPPSLVDI